MTNSGYKKHLKRNKKVLPHSFYRRLIGKQNLKATESILDKVVDKALETIVIYAINLIAFIILLLFIRHYYNFVDERDILEFVAEIFSKLK